jgi:hypothetical protein
MEYLNIDKKQLVGEVRERNRYFMALTAIQAIVADSTNLQCDEKTEKILKICNEALTYHSSS